MNTLKNIVVTGMLLIVAYGAYVVMHSDPGQLGEDPDSLAADLPVPEVDMGQFDAPGVENPDLGDPEPLPSPDLAPDILPEPPPYVPPQTSSVADGSSSADNPVRRATDEPQIPPFDGGVREPAPPPVSPPALAAGSADSVSGEGTNAPTESPDFEAAWQRANQHLAANDMVAALRELSAWHNDPRISDEQRQRCLNFVDELAGAVIYSPQSYLKSPYTIQPNDTLEGIAKLHQVPLEFLAKVNGITPPYHLTAGQTIKVVQGPFEAQVDVARQEMTIMLGDLYAGRFPVAVGHNLPPGETDLVVGERTFGHAFHDMEKNRHVQSTDPENPYGQYWLGMRGEKVSLADHVGIHARGSGSDVVDRGGVILDDTHAEDVHSILSVGSRIRILR